MRLAPQEYFERTADAAIRRMEGALWVGVTERMEEAACLLFLTLGKKEREMEQYRLKIPRPVSVRQAKTTRAGRVMYATCLRSDGRISSSVT